jgi:CubicO group peptidase (beta-lactamase class C family)
MVHAAGTPPDLGQEVDRLALDVGLSGAVRIDLDGRVAYERGYRLAQRGLGIDNDVDTQFAIASGTKGLTALTVMRLVELGTLELHTTARSLLGGDLPLVDERVTVEHLLSHRSGIGDYLDEHDTIDLYDYLMPVPVHQLATTEEYLRVLDGHPATFAPGDGFRYNNSGYVLLALMAERAAGSPFHELVDELVCAPAGMADTAFIRTDELPGRAASGYVDDDGLRTNVFHLPVRGSGDGGLFTTIADVHSLWRALYAGQVVAPATWSLMTQPSSPVDPDRTDELRYGLGFWLGATDSTVSIHGFDPGVGFVSEHDPARGVTFTVMSNQSRGAWPMSQRLAALLA